MLTQTGSMGEKLYRDALTGCIIAAIMRMP